MKKSSALKYGVVFVLGLAIGIIGGMEYKSYQVRKAVSNIFNTPEKKEINGMVAHAEAKSNLVSLVTAQIAFMAEAGYWGADFHTIGWVPDPDGETYTYYLSCGKYCSKGSLSNHSQVPKKVGASCEIAIHSGKAEYTECPKEAKEWLNSSDVPGKSGGFFKAVAVGNIDRDDTLDVWGIDASKEPKILVDDTVK